MGLEASVYGAAALTILGLLIGGWLLARSARWRF
jgi:hypothetical protein